MNVYRMYPEYEQSKSAGIAQILAAALQAYSQGKDKKRKQGQEDEEQAYLKKYREAQLGEMGQNEVKSRLANENTRRLLEARIAAAGLKPEDWNPSVAGGQPRLDSMMDQSGMGFGMNPFEPTLQDSELRANPQTDKVMRELMLWSNDPNPDALATTAAAAGAPEWWRDQAIPESGSSKSKAASLEFRKNKQASDEAFRQQVEKRKAKAQEAVQRIREQAEARHQKLLPYQINNLLMGWDNLLYKQELSDDEFERKVQEDEMRFVNSNDYNVTRGAKPRQPLPRVQRDAPPPRMARTDMPAPQVGGAAPVAVDVEAKKRQAAANAKAAPGYAQMTDAQKRELLRAELAKFGIR